MVGKSLDDRQVDIADGDAADLQPMQEMPGSAAIGHEGRSAAHRLKKGADCVFRRSAWRVLRMLRKRYLDVVGHDLPSGCCNPRDCNYAEQPDPENLAAQALPQVTSA